MCWKIKPWKQPKAIFGGQHKLFSSIFASAWGADCDEVHPGLFIGDKESATNVAFLKKYGITHVLNTAEGSEEGLVDLNADHYDGTGITYLGFPLWDAPGCNLIPYLGIAADYICSSINHSGGKCLVNCQMGVSRSASCAIAYMMIHLGMTSVEALTLIRKSRDCRPNDGFLSQLSNVDNALRKERELGLPKQIRLSTLEDRFRLPLSWHTEFWTPGEVTEEELGFPLLPMGKSILSMKSLPSSSTPSISRKTSVRSSRTSSKRNSFRAGLCSNKRSSTSRRSSIKRSRPNSICLSTKSDDTAEWEWVWETDDEEIEEEASLEEKLQEVNDIIAGPEEKWRQMERIPSPTSSYRSNCTNGFLSAQMGVEQDDPLSLVKVASAKQWKAISRKLTINFDDFEEEDKHEETKSEVSDLPYFGAIDVKIGSSSQTFKTPLDEAIEEAMKAKSKPVDIPSFLPFKEQDLDVPSRPQTPESFNPTTVQELRRICWQIKPWDQPVRKTFAERQLFTSILGTPWGVDADEVHPRILVGDQAAARNIRFLKKYGITHVLNAAQGPWTEHCVDLSEEHYIGSGITYLVMKLQNYDVVLIKYIFHMIIAGPTIMG